MSRQFVIFLGLTLAMFTTIASAGVLANSWQWWAMAAIWIGNIINEGIK